MLGIKKIILTHQILSFICSAITLPVISTLKLSEAVTDRKESLPVFPAGVHLGERGGLCTCRKGGDGAG